MRRFLLVSLFLALLFNTLEPLKAQTKLSLKRKVVNDSIQHQGQPKAEVAIDFPNINKIPYYQDRGKLREINRLERRRDYNKALPLLQEYVNNFGIENFYRNTPMLWRLAQLYERKNDMAHAKGYYRLAIKHHRSDIEKVKLYYDSLEAKTKSFYVPLNYYYELVEYRKAVNTFQPPKGVYTNMGPDINSKYEDYGPTINANTERLIFTSRRNRGPSINSGYNEDLFYAENNNGTWNQAKSFGKPINSVYNEGSACLSKDGQTLYFARCDCPDSFGNCDLYTAKKMKNGTWGNIKNLGLQVNSPSWDSQPALSQNEDTLYFASDRLGGFGTSDIYFTFKQKNGRWAPAQNMGPVINTRENEVSPFFHPKYQVLYFSSRGQLLNNGDYDIYKTYRVNGRWQEPRNIGPLVNGKGSEYYFTIDGKSENLYYARSEENDLKNLDLFSFPLPMEAHPLAVTRLEGTLLDSVTNKPLTGIVSVIDLTSGIEVASKYIRKDGSFDFDLIDQSRYMLLIQSPDFFSVEKEIDLKQDTIFKIMTTAIDYKIPLIFKNIEFDEGRSNIKPVMEPILDRIVLFMADHPTFKLKIGGHTDSSGDVDFNTELSQKRADSIKKYIEQKGKIPEGRIEAWGYGSSEQLREEITEEDRRINRRVEFKLIKPEPANLKE
ncbi:OmpA family protein [Adhaeribacter radiodurans]|uniref:OmpA family protein n=1 Tax=Adhaeribacter radiodurans TaxID=2745197 RepID=A0A7L7LAI1_9BACT|nr:OmpA family protein [Adhaeribacter radiodurans]QMU29830.1 OmpA family protein [Adhaeribacter radiodurans]